MKKVSLHHLVYRVKTTKLLQNLSNNLQGEKWFISMYFFSLTSSSFFNAG